MNRQLTCQISLDDTAIALSHELVHLGFINDVRILEFYICICTPALNVSNEQTFRHFRVIVRKSRVWSKRRYFRRVNSSWAQRGSRQAMVIRCTFQFIRPVSRRFSKNTLQAQHKIYILKNRKKLKVLLYTYNIFVDETECVFFWLDKRKPENHN